MKNPRALFRIVLKRREDLQGTSSGPQTQMAGPDRIEQSRSASIIRGRCHLNSSTRAAHAALIRDSVRSGGFSSKRGDGAGAGRRVFGEA